MEPDAQLSDTDVHVRKLAEFRDAFIQTLQSDIPTIRDLEVYGERLRETASYRPICAPPNDEEFNLELWRRHTRNWGFFLKIYWDEVDNKSRQCLEVMSQRAGCMYPGDTTTRQYITSRARSILDNALDQGRRNAFDLLPTFVELERGASIDPGDVGTYNDQFAKLMDEEGEMIHEESEKTDAELDRLRDAIQVFVRQKVSYRLMSKRFALVVRRETDNCLALARKGISEL